MLGVKTVKADEIKSKEPVESRAAALKNLSVRGVDFGDSLESVKKRFSGKQIIEESRDGFSFADEVGGIGCVYGFVFEENRMVKAAIKFVEERASDNSYFEDYVAINKLLREKYGEVEVKQNWKDDTFQTDLKDIGMALASEQLTIICTWKVDNGTITHMIYGQNFKISHLVLYGLDSIDERLHQASQKEEKDKL